jgi:uncharacterized membrane protein/YHS domain-containing protein
MTFSRFRWALAIVLAGVVALAAHAGAQPTVEANKTCPVMTGEPIKDSVYEDYNGQRIYFCCTKCQAKFRANPAKYLANLPQFAGTAAGGGSGDEPSALPSAVPGPQLSTNQASAQAPGLIARLARLLGRLHPLIVHFPIALLIVSGLLIATTATRHSRAAKDAARLCMILGAFGAVGAAGMGWLNARYEHGGLGEDTASLGVHRWLGLAVAVIALFAGVMALRTYKREVLMRQLPARWRPVNALGGLLLAVLVGVTGHYGGLTAYGDNYLWEAFRPNQPLAAPTPVASNAPILIGAAPKGGPSAAASGTTPRSGSVPAAVQDLLFNSSDAEVFAVRRAARLAEITPPSGPEGLGPSAPSNPSAAIDQFVRNAWAAANLPEAKTPPQLCDDSTFLRRVYLDIIGVIPTIEESDRFLADASPDKRERLIDELLARDQDCADHWTPFWEDALGSSNVQLQGGVPTRGNYRKWINDAFRENRAFDLFAAQLIDTEIPGAKKPEIAEANTRKSRISYIRFETHTDTLQSAAAVAQVFMGTSMKCASCHSHFENDEWPQKRFLAYAGLFGPHDLELIRCEKKSGEFIPARFAFDIPGAPMAAPQEEQARLRRAAQLLTDPQNPRFAKSIVNRLWKRYMGLGLFEPADDFRLNVAPSHPELLEWLAYDFMSHNDDVKHTMRLILNSRTYQTAYNPALEDHFDIAKKTEPRYFRSPTLRRLTAEQVADSLRVAATQHLDPMTRLYHSDRSTALSRALGKPASRNEISTQRPDDNAVVQALELLNGEEFNALIYSSAILAGATSDIREHENAGAADESITRLYRALYTRWPREEELSLARAFLQSAASGAAAPAPPREITLIDDDTPPNARLVGEWNWVTSPVSKGKRAHQQTSKDKPVQHYALGNSGSPVSALDTLFVDVYLDPKDPPKEIMIQWNDGSMGDGWDHRAYWGENMITFGEPESPSRRFIGPLPEPGKWSHLEVRAADVGFIGASRIVGMSFDQQGGTVTFDNAGLIHRELGPEYQALGDLLWSLAANPEFHYIR